MVMVRSVAGSQTLLMHGNRGSESSDHAHRARKRHEARLRDMEMIEEKLCARIDARLRLKTPAVPSLSPSSDSEKVFLTRIEILEKCVATLEMKMKTVPTSSDVGASLQTVLVANGITSLSGRFDSMEMVTRNAHHENLVMVQQLVEKFQANEQRLSILEAQSEAMASAMAKGIQEASSSITGSGISGKGSSSPPECGLEMGLNTCPRRPPPECGLETRPRQPPLECGQEKPRSSAGHVVADVSGGGVPGSTAEPGQRKADGRVVADVSCGSVSGSMAEPGQRKADVSEGGVEHGVADVTGSSFSGSLPEPGQRKADASGACGAKWDYSRFDHIKDSDDENGSDDEDRDEDDEAGLCHVCYENVAVSEKGGVPVCGSCARILKRCPDDGG